MTRITAVLARVLTDLISRTGARRYAVGAGILLAVGLVPISGELSDPWGELYDCEETISGSPELCTHGSQPFPDGVSPKRRPSVDELRKRGRMWSGEVATDGTSSEAIVTEGAWAIVCIGDGVTGNRVQAIYARAADVPSRYVDVVPLIRGYAADVDLAISTAASARGVDVASATSPSAANWMSRP